MKLCLVSHPDDTVRSFRVSELVSDWGVGTPRVVDSPDKLQSDGLFSSIPVYVLFLENLDSVKNALPVLEKTVGEGFGSHLIIDTPVPARSLKKFSAWVKSLGGEVRIEDKKSMKGLARDLVSGLQVPVSVKNFLIDYAGDDPRIILGVYRDISSLSAKEQKGFTVEQVALMLPLPPGATPPWEVEKALFGKSLPRLVSVYRTVVTDAHYLVVLSFVVRAFHNMCYAQNVSADGVKELSGKSGYPLTIIRDRGRKYDRETVLKCLSILVDVSAKVKGGSRVDPVSLVEIALIKVFLLLQ